MVKNLGTNEKKILKKLINQLSGDPQSLSKQLIYEKQDLNTLRMLGVWMQRPIVHPGMVFCDVFCRALQVSLPHSLCSPSITFYSSFSSRRRAACQQPPEFVRTRVMYSALFPCFHLRAAHFLLPGYTNCSISILQQDVTGSWGFNGDCTLLRAVIAPPLNTHTRTQTRCNVVCSKNCMFSISLYLFFKVI